MRFDWDDTKAEANRRKHGVGFDEAATVWQDPFRYSFHDVDHSEREERRIMIGMSERDRLLFVSYQEFEDDAVIRLISTRRATRNERSSHEQRIIDRFR